MSPYILYWSFNMKAMISLIIGTRKKVSNLQPSTNSCLCEALLKTKWQCVLSQSDHEHSRARFLRPGLAAWVMAQEKRCLCLDRSLNAVVLGQGRRKFVVARVTQLQFTMTNDLGRQIKWSRWSVTHSYLWLQTARSLTLTSELGKDLETARTCIVCIPSTFLQLRKNTHQLFFTSK